MDEVADVVDSFTDTGALQSQELIIRFENGRGGFNAFAIDTERMAKSMGEAYPDWMQIIPGILRPPVDGLLFAIRHGIIQKLMKDREMGAPEKDAKDKNAQAVELLMRVIYHDLLKASRDERGEVIPVDITRDDLHVAYGGIFRRIPQYDALEGPGAEQTAIDAPTGVAAATEAPV